MRILIYNYMYIYKYIYIYICGSQKLIKLKKYNLQNRNYNRLSLFSYSTIVSLISPLFSFVFFFFLSLFLISSKMHRTSLSLSLFLSLSFLSLSFSLSLSLCPFSCCFLYTLYYMCIYNLRVHWLENEGTFVKRKIYSF